MMNSLMPAARYTCPAGGNGSKPAFWQAPTRQYHPGFGLARDAAAAAGVNPARAEALAQLESEGQEPL